MKSKIEHDHYLSKLEGDLVLRGLDKLIPTMRESGVKDTAIILAEHFRIGRQPAKVGFRLRK